MKELKHYQEEAVDKLHKYINMGFNEKKATSIVFRSPTGSGKTFIMSQLILDVIKDDELKNLDFCFLWVSIGKGNLHQQSYKSLKKEFKVFPNVYLLENEFSGGREVINKNDVVVLNWEKLRTKDNETGKWKNIVMKDKETNNFIDVLNNTRAEGRKIILIIDESHASTNTDRANELRDEIIRPDITLEMSATPALKDYDYKYGVDPTDVIKEGMIKKEILINENIDKISENELDSETLILESAYKKRRELKKAYEEAGEDINPLVIVQLPNSADGEKKKDVVEDFLRNKGIHTEKRNLAIWLSEEKVHNEEVFLTPNNSNVDFLIFKQAIDTGWNCPRAQVMVKFRETKSITFEIQTVGRILRMPEAHHYDNEVLNKAYVYTNLQSIDVKREEYNPNIIKSLSIKRKDFYSDLKLNSYYKQRLDYGDITAGIYDVIVKVFNKEFGVKEPAIMDSNLSLFKKKLEVENLTDGDVILLNEKIMSEVIDDLPHIEGNNKLSVKLSENDKIKLFETIITNNLNGFARKRSLDSIKPAIYRYFRNYMGIDFNDNGLVKIQALVIHNNKKISELLHQSTLEYKSVKEQELEEKANSIENWQKDWELPKTINYNSELFEEYNAKLYIYDRCFLEKKTDKENNPERAFVRCLEDSSEVVEWWWKNGDEHSRDNFGIPYNKKGSTFQPDFIVKLKDGRIGIFDTKGAGFNEADNKEKAEALQRYIKEENSKGKKLFGGIIIKHGEHLKLNSNIEYNSYQTHSNEWEFLKL
ncbi:MAG: hypothetical protein EOM53_02695 [Alphaproteobacteria bacterium]|nr:hypothetical protein [Alphaproteobacteria bacterium]